MERFGNQAVLYALRDRRHPWSSRPSRWVLASSAVDITIVATLALAGVLMAPLPADLVAGVFAAAIAFALILDQIKAPILSFSRAK